MLLDPLCSSSVRFGYNGIVTWGCYSEHKIESSIVFSGLANPLVDGSLISKGYEILRSTLLQSLHLFPCTFSVDVALCLFSLSHYLLYTYMVQSAWIVCKTKFLSILVHGTIVNQIRSTSWRTRSGCNMRFIARCATNQSPLQYLSSFPFHWPLDCCLLLMGLLRPVVSKVWNCRHNSLCSRIFEVYSEVFFWAMFSAVMPC